jgi:hypothetical protein
MKTSTLKLVSAALVGVGLAAFVVQLASPHPERAWQAYLINFLLWSAMAQGALLFSALMHTTRAKWSGPLAGLAESFSAFFPISLVLFVGLFLGREHIFPWLHADLHGKEVWLNLPFLFARDFGALLLLYLLGLAYTYQSLGRRLSAPATTGLRGALCRRWARGDAHPERRARRQGVLSILYMLAFALVLSLIGYDLVMAADPHWYSTLFGAYSFVKAIYVGFGALIVLAAILHLAPGSGFGLPPENFHDLGKLFFAFCLVWADFFYAQLVVIWYGNIPEETAYVIGRTLLQPWKGLAWAVFVICFAAPFLVLLNRKVKTRPRFMLIFCSLVIAGMWLEHLLLLGPAWNHQAATIPFGVIDVLITMGFLGLMSLAIAFFLQQFPELTRTAAPEVN